MGLGTVLVFRVEELAVIPKRLSADDCTDAKEADDLDNAAAREATLDRASDADANSPILISSQ